MTLKEQILQSLSAGGVKGDQLNSAAKYLEEKLSALGVTDLTQLSATQESRYLGGDSRTSGREGQVVDYSKYRGEPTEAYNVLKYGDKNLGYITDQKGGKAASGGSLLNFQDGEYRYVPVQGRDGQITFQAHDVEGSAFTGIRDMAESAAVSAGNYFVPGSATLTQHLVSDGAKKIQSMTGAQLINLAAGAAGASADATPAKPSAPKPDLSFSDALDKAIDSALTPKNLMNVGKNAALNAATQYVVNDGEIDWGRVAGGAAAGMIGNIAGSTARGMNVFGDSMLGNAGEAAIGGAVGGGTRAALTGGDVGKGLLSGGLTSGASSLVNQAMGNDSSKTADGGYIHGAAGGAINAIVNGKGGREIIESANDGGFGGAISGAAQEYLGMDASFANLTGNLATQFVNDKLAEDVTATPGSGTPTTVTPTTPATPATPVDPQTSFGTAFQIGYKDITKHLRTWERG
jgi:hypothetical protein